MTLNQINHLNTDLMMASVAIAAVVPFELFLFASGAAVFAIDYRIGVSALFTLSLVHVFLEFPLNHRTFAAIGGALVGAVHSAARSKSCA